MPIEGKSPSQPMLGYCRCGYGRRSGLAVRRRRCWRRQSRNSQTLPPARISDPLAAIGEKTINTKPLPHLRQRSLTAAAAGEMFGPAQIADRPIKILPTGSEIGAEEAHELAVIFGKDGELATPHDMDIGRVA
jgi:hypothetical protein